MHCIENYESLRSHSRKGVVHDHVGFTFHISSEVMLRLIENNITKTYIHIYIIATPTFDYWTLTPPERDLLCNLCSSPL